MSDPVPSNERLSYRLLTGKGDRAFCESVSRALADGYVLYGSPAIAVSDGHTVSAQAVVLPSLADDLLDGEGLYEA